jgi:hypothetical protein
MPFAMNKLQYSFVNSLAFDSVELIKEILVFQMSVYGHESSRSFRMIFIILVHQHEVIIHKANDSLVLFLSLCLAPKV